MTEQKLNLDNPITARILAWMDERFPLKNAIVCVVWYLFSALLARYSDGDGSVYLGFVDVFNALAAWSFFLLLRVYDEHKDYELDMQNYPERVLQSGLINLTHLKVIGILCVAYQLFWCVYLDEGFGNIFVAWLVMFIYGLLMAKEFFVGAWLEKRLFLYALTHQLIVPMIVWWMCCLGDTNVAFSGVVILLVALSFATSMNLELVRKTRGPEEERDTVDSYSKVFGTVGSAYFVLALATVMFVLMLVILNVLVSSSFLVGNGLIVVAYLYSAISLYSFIRAPSLAGREKNELACALLMLIGYSVLIAAIVTEQQLNFQLWV